MRSYRLRFCIIEYRSAGRQRIRVGGTKKIFTLKIKQVGRCYLWRVVVVGRSGQKTILTTALEGKKGVCAPWGRGPCTSYATGYNIRILLYAYSTGKSPTIMPLLEDYKILSLKIVFNVLIINQSFGLNF